MTTRPFERILSVSELEETANRLDNYFFTPGAMRFFASQVDYKLFAVDGSRGYFVTSERYYDMRGDSRPRCWTVRQYAIERYTREDGRECDRLKIDSVGSFQEWASLSGARRRAEELQGYALIDSKSFEMDRELV